MKDIRQEQFTKAVGNSAEINELLRRYGVKFVTGRALKMSVTVSLLPIYRYASEHSGTTTKMQGISHLKR